MNTIAEVIETLQEYKSSVEMSNKILGATGIPEIEKALSLGQGIIAKIDRLLLELDTYKDK